jgi:hypothetical protein
MRAQVAMVDLIAKPYLSAGKEILVHPDLNHIVSTIEFHDRQKLAIAFAAHL